MAITHSFNDNADYTEGGKWSDDFGRIICQWQWNASLREITVACGKKGSRIDLSKLDEQQLSDKQLKERLPTLAIETAQRTNKTTYDF